MNVCMSVHRVFNFSGTYFVRAGVSLPGYLPVPPSPPRGGVSSGGAQARWAPPPGDYPSPRGSSPADHTAAPPRASDPP